MSDKAIIESIGSFVKHKRLAQNKTQSQTAKEAGINRWTLGQIENGESVTLLSLIQILRALDLLYILDIFRIEEKVSPIELAKAEQKQRKRARDKKQANKPKSNW